MGGGGGDGGDGGDVGDGGGDGGDGGGGATATETVGPLGKPWDELLGHTRNARIRVRANVAAYHRRNPRTVN